MVSAIQTKPALLLQPFISCYTLRTFDTNGAILSKQMHAVQESYLTLFLKDPTCRMEEAEGKNNTTISHALVNMLTEYHGCSCWKGAYILFSIQFKSNGFFAIFGIPQKILVNTILSVNEIFGNSFDLLIEQLTEAKNFSEMCTLMNTYLTRLLLNQKHKAYTNAIAAVAHLVQKNKGIISLDDMAYYANMSSRNLERRFLEEVGMSPKLYSRITRFYGIIETMLSGTHKRWSDLIYEYEYFDQSHFIKDVKAFSSQTPDELLKNILPAAENYIAE